jgi:hypothetical protein
MSIPPYQGLTNKDANRTRDYQCFEKARAKGEMTFTVVEHDLTSPLTILRWIELNFATCPREKLLDAFHDALNMRDSTIPKKAAD